MTTKKSFLLHIDSLDVLDHLTDEQCGQLLKAFKSYHSGDELELSPMLSIAFTPFKNQFKRDLNTYENVCNRNKINGMKGGRPRNPENPVGSLVTQRNPEKPKKPDSDNDSDNKKDSDSGNESDNDNKRKAKKRFSPPSINDIQAFINEKSYHVNAEVFFNHYESNGWKVGNNPMKSWKAALANWNSRENKPASVSEKERFYAEMGGSSKTIDGEYHVIK
jgi:hypothetical protein